MLHYIQRRLVLSIPLLIGITIISYVIISLAPGDPFSALIDPSAQVEGERTYAELEALKEQHGLNRPVLIRYFFWLKEVAQGNLGYSIHTDTPVAELVLSRLPATLMLTVSSTVLSMTIGVMLGVISALRQYTLFDYLMTATAFFGVSIPSFFVAMMSIYVFGVRLKWLPIYGMWTPGEPATVLDFLRHAILPVMALSVIQIAGYMRYARAATLDALGGDYVTTARAKGLRE
ncbi:MAG: ABC transporter permease, partial [Candidatus Binatia bacterium]